MEEKLPQIAIQDFSKRILILCKEIKKPEITIGGARQIPWYKVKTLQIYFYDTIADILLKNHLYKFLKLIHKKIRLEE